MSGDTIAMLGVGVTLLAAILTFGFALLGAHRATQATLNQRMDRMDQRVDRMDQRMDRMEQRMDRMEQRMDRMEQRFDRVEATLDGLRRDVTDIDRRLSRIEGAVLGPWRPEPPTEPPPAREARQEPVPASGTAGPRQ
ncbi:MAG: hypothetical protein OXH96_07500 [Spirochaetaceae bacterium]|nr:hypothetical protein [Spirochaetaceae bacterium]